MKKLHQFSSKLNKKWIWVSFSIVFLGVFLIQICAPYWVCHRLGKSLKTQIHGTISPEWQFGRFSCRNVRFQWDNRVEVLSGELIMNYNLESIFSKQRYRLRIESNQLEVSFKGDWQYLYSAGNIPVQRLEADLSFDTHSIKEIHQLTLESPAFHFDLKPSV